MSYNFNSVSTKFNSDYTQNYRKLRGYLVSRVGRDQSRDLGQSVWATYWNALTKGLSIQSPTGFLIMVAKNHVFNHYRRRGKEAEQLSDVTGQALVSRDGEPLDDLILKESFETIQKYLEDQDEDTREFLARTLLGGEVVTSVLEDFADSGRVKSYKWARVRLDKAREVLAGVLEEPQEYSLS